MNLNHMTIDEILARIEQGIVDDIPADIALKMFEDGFDRGYDNAMEHKAFNGDLE